MAKVDPRIQPFLKTLNELSTSGIPALYKMSPTEARRFLNSIQIVYGQSLPPIPAFVEDLVIPTRAGPVSVRMVRSFKQKDNRWLSSAILYLHGGGWVLGSKFSHDRLILNLANQTGSTIVFVDYTAHSRSQIPFPTGTSVWSGNVFVSIRQITGC